MTLAILSSQTDRMLRWISTRISLRVIVLVLMPVTYTCAQVSTANVAGIVEDSTEARIPDANVKLINSLTGAENDSKTNRVGIFLLPNIIPGAYSLQIERDGFATVQFSSLVLNVGDTKNFVVRMQVGSTMQTINIDGSGIAPNSTDASVSTVVDRQFVANIPLNGRSFQDLISMTPGVVSQSPQAIGAGYGMQGDFSVNGERPDTNSYTIDGVSADIGVGPLTWHEKLASSGTAAGTTALGTTQSLVSIDDLQEFRVFTSNYSVEYGRTTGGQFTLLTRSGTDALHGSLFDYVRNSTANAADWFAGYNGAYFFVPYRQNDFGGSVGGPIFVPHVFEEQNNTFFFLSYEGFHVTEPMAPIVQYVPSDQTKATAPSPLHPILNAFPQSDYRNVAEVPPASTGLSPFVFGVLAEPGSINSTSARIDHLFSPKLSAFIRSGFTPSTAESDVLASLTTNHVYTQTDTLGVSFQLSAASTNQFRLGYGVSTSLLNTVLGYPGTPADLSADLGIPTGTFPSVAADVYIHSAGAGDSEINTDAAFGSVHQWNLRDTFSLQASHHLLQFGIDEHHLVSTVHPPALTVETNFFNPQSILENLASDISITKSLPASPVFQEFAAFAQDEWRVSKSLTVSAGLRWDINPAPRGKRGVDAYTLRGDITTPSTLKLAPRGTPLWSTSWLNFAPRVGVAWNADRRQGHELVVRAGGGIFFDTTDRAAVPAFSALGFFTTELTANASVPVTVFQTNFSTNPSSPYTNSLVFDFPQHLQIPYSIQWNLALEKSLGKDQTITASYIGANGRRLLKEQRTNLHAQNPEFGEVVSFPSGITSNYQALQLKFQRSMLTGMSGLVSYVWSHSLDYGSTDPVWPLKRSNSDFDVRQNLEAALSLSRPHPNQNRISQYIFGDWGLDLRLTARTAFPVTPLGNIFSDPATGNRYFSGVDLIPNRPLYIYGSQYPNGRMLNGGPYATNPALTFPASEMAGNAPRNMLRGFGDYQANIAFRREIHLHDRFHLQARAEAYNLFNHPNLGYIDPSLADQLFGQATLMLNQSFGPTGSLYEPGGPRSLQLSLRIHF